MEDVEIELQMSVEFVKPLLNFLEKNGSFQYETHQIDEYFSPPHRDFLAVRPVKEWLRLRNADGKHSVNYKNWHYEADGTTSYYCDEYETKVENLDKIKKIFEALNFKPLVVVNKIRKIWMYKDFEISLDAVRGLGDLLPKDIVILSAACAPFKPHSRGVIAGGRHGTFQGCACASINSARGYFCRAGEKDN